MKKTKLIFTSNLSKQLIIYLLFSLVLWIVNLCFISSTAFIHFLLDHSLSTIDEWIFDKGWELVLLSKLSTVTIMFKFLEVQDKRRNSLLYILSEGKMGPPKEFFILVIFLTSAIFAIGHPFLNVEYEFSFLDLIVHFFGIFIFYMTDFFISVFLDKTYPISGFDKFVKLVMFSFIFYFTSKYTFLYGKGMDFLIIFHFVIGIFLSNYKKLNWMLTFLVLLVFTCPISLVLGLDPIYKNMHSIFSLKKSIEVVTISSMIITSFLYLYGKDFLQRWIRRKRIE